MRQSSSRVTRASADALSPNSAAQTFEVEHHYYRRRRRRYLGYLGLSDLADDRRRMVGSKPACGPAIGRKGW
jgi:hypothetical protein